MRASAREGTPRPTMEWSLSTVFETVASAAPDRDMLVWKISRRTYGYVVS
jgi:hypothetical protein